MDATTMSDKQKLEVIDDFVRRVNQRAEEKIAITHRLEGSHYAAMMHELKLLQERAAGSE